MKKILIYIISFVFVLSLLVILINFYVTLSTKKRIIKQEDALRMDDVDCILVLGAGVRGNRPSPLLQDRLNTAIDLYNKGNIKKIIMSGDHGQEHYDEVTVMKNYAIEKGVPSSDIFMDHAGFSTYESIYRAKTIFGLKKVIVVTQKYHLYRALYISKQLDLESYGVMANPNKYSGAIYRETREVLARNKDFVKSIFKPKPTYLGDAISIDGNGDITND